MMKDEALNVYELSRAWFDFAFANPEKIKTNHPALFFFAIEHCNRLGWKPKFGLPTSMAMEAIGIKSYNTYIATLTDLVEWGFIKMIEKSKNQYSSNIVALSKNNNATDKALDKALTKHTTKQIVKQRESIDSIDKQYYNNTIDTSLQLEEEVEEAPEPFEIIIALKRVNNLPKFIKDKFLRSEETLKMKLTEKIYFERQDEFMLRHNERTYPNENDFLNHYRNFILSKPPPEQKEKYSGQKEKPNRIEQLQTTHDAVLNNINKLASQHNSN